MILALDDTKDLPPRKLAPYHNVKLTAIADPICQPFVVGHNRVRIHHLLKAGNNDFKGLTWRHPPSPVFLLVSGSPNH